MVKEFLYRAIYSYMLLIKCTNHIGEVTFVIEIICNNDEALLWDGHEYSVASLSWQQFLTLS